MHTPHNHTTASRNEQQHQQQPPSNPNSPPAPIPATTTQTHPAEEAGEVGESPRGHLLEDHGEDVRLAALGGGLELHHERLALRGKRERPRRDHHRPTVVCEGDALQGRRGVLFLELPEDRAELGRGLCILFLEKGRGEGTI